MRLNPGKTPTYPRLFDARNNGVPICTNGLNRDSSIPIPVSVTVNRTFASLDELQNDTNIDKGDISRDFGGKRGLTRELIAFALTPDENSFVIEDANRAVAALLDSEVDLQDSIERIAAADDAYHDADELLRAQLAIWALSSASDQPSRDQLKELYRYFDSEHLVAWNALLDELADAGITPAGGMNSEEFVAILSAVTEGTAIRAAVDSGLRPRGLTGKALILLFEAMLKLPDEETELGAKLTKLDLLRRRSERQWWTTEDNEEVHSTFYRLMPL